MLLQGKLNVMRIVSGAVQPFQFGWLIAGRRSWYRRFPYLTEQTLEIAKQLFLQPWKDQIPASRNTVVYSH